MNRSSSKIPSPWAAWLLPLPDLLWVLFLVWTAVGAVVMPFGIGPVQVVRWIPNTGARAAAIAILHGADAFWIALAAVNVYLATAAAEGLSVTRAWTVIILVGAGLVEWIGACTGYPFGPYRYTDAFGWRMGGVLPFTIPLAWLIILLSGRRLVLAIRPEVERLGLAIGVALVAVLTDLNLEPVAWKIRGYWTWYPGVQPPSSGWPPWQNYASWFAVAFALTYALKPNYEMRRPVREANRSIIVLALLNGLFVLANIVRWMRGSG